MFERNVRGKLANYFPKIDGGDLRKVNQFYVLAKCVSGVEESRNDS